MSWRHHGSDGKTWRSESSGCWPLRKLAMMEAPLGVVLRNARSLITVFLFGPGRIERLIGKACANPQFDRNGFYYARGEMILGLLCMHRKKREKAIDHLREARRIVTQIGPSPFLARIDSALETLGARKV